MSGGRDGALARAAAHCASGALAAELGALVAYPTVSADPAQRGVLHAYLTEAIAPRLEAIGYVARIHPNPDPAGGPFLVASRTEDPALPTLLTYGHGDVVPGLDAQWSGGRSPWTLAAEGERLYGRGTADNKMQHLLILAALEHVLAERGSHGFNSTILIETGEEVGSPGLDAFVAAERERLAADLFLASDGPRKNPRRAELSLGNRGSVAFDLVADLRPGGGRHSGHWGGVLTDPAIRLAHAIASIVSQDGRILAPGLTPGTLPEPVRRLFAALDPGPEPTEPAVDPNWGEPGLSRIEKAMAWTSFVVLAMLCGTPERPVNGVQARASARCQIRHTVDVDAEQLLPALRRHLDAMGFADLEIRPTASRYDAWRTDPTDPWVAFAARSLERTTGEAPNVVPNSSGGLPSAIFARRLGVPVLWVPHSYAGCLQHGPDEHVLTPLMREGAALMTGLFWDLGESPPA